MKCCQRDEKDEFSCGREFCEVGKTLQKVCAGHTTNKGKEIQQEQPLPSTDQQEEMADAAANTKQQTQEQVLPRQEVTVETSVLQTPTNEERNRKRDREIETPLTTSTNQQGEKRQRLNPFSDEEVPTRPSMGMGPPSTEASASSFQQEQERQHGGEVSSAGQ